MGQKGKERENLTNPTGVWWEIFTKYDGTHLKTIGKGMIGYIAAGVSMDLARRIVSDAFNDKIILCFDCRKKERKKPAKKEEQKKRKKKEKKKEGFWVFFG